MGRGPGGHPPGERARRLATLSVELAEVAPAPLKALERAHLAGFLAARAHACDLTLRLAREWAARRRVEGDAVCALALATDAVCDCELAARLAIQP